MPPQRAALSPPGYGWHLRRSGRSVIARSVPLVAAALGVVCLIACIDAFSTPYNQCDNMAGTCIRERQVAAIVGLQMLCVAGVLASALAAFGWGRWRLR